MPPTSGCSASLRKLAALTVVVGALCRLAAANPTCNAGFDWAFNDLNQSPCDVTAALGGVCTGGSFSLANLTSTQIYTGPSAGFGTPCRCNTVYYSTLSACALCQGATFTTWTAYNTNCTTVYTEIFPSPIPSGFSVPHWAYLDVTAANTFDPTLAQAAGGSDSTAVPQATGSTTPTTSTHPSSSKNKTNAGAIAGGVVGGVVGLAAIAGIVIWLLGRRKNASSRPTPGTYDPQPFTSYEKPAMGTMDTSNTGTAFVSTPPPKLYDPNDPSTFPSHVAQSYTGTTNTSSAPQQPLYPNPNFPANQQIRPGPGGHSQYTGAPEL
ncbi:hypothetical protein M413DRAFT_439213 [Hebeloma cylindrosporum]|uniref:Transmembrane protein n=1 Tax=Hebeloma cylindrosporum TaxID=76867 RepID=A0A0C3CTW2_HEBCY|nr:hypothetical protein M413DRAFT_439213 [Hebeloma cylindrosporum h7]